MKKAISVLFLLLLLFAYPVAAAPFDPSDAYGLLPNTYNPANRDVPIFVLTTGVSAESNSLNYQLIPLLNADWSDEEREWVGSLIGKNGLSLSANVMPVFGLNFKIFGLNAAGKASVSGTIPKHFTDLLFYGHDAQKLIDEEVITYDFKDLNGHGAAYLEAGITLAHTRKRLTLGLNAKYLYGFGYGDAYGNGMIVTAHKDGETSISGQDLDFTMFYAMEGAGYSFDVGARYQLSNSFAVEGSVLNIGQIHWQDGVKYQVRREGEFNLLKFGFDTEEMKFIFETDELEESEELFEEVEETNLEYIWRLPRVTRVGADWQLGRSLRLRGEVNHTKHYQVDGESSTIGLAGGMEYRLLRIFPIRITGQKVLNEQAIINGGIGLNLGPIRVDASVHNILGALMKDRRGFGAGVSATLKF